MSALKGPEVLVVYGENVRYGRQLAARMTAKELARRIRVLNPESGIDHTRISRIEHGLEEPRPAVRVAIAAILGRPVHWFYKPHPRARRG